METDVCVNNTLAREEEVLKLVLVQLGSELEALQVVPEKLCRRRHVALFYRAQARQLGILLVEPESKSRFRAELQGQCR